ncbi:MAG: A/G-specific adenine glycosylase [Clostridia bacterium]|nr:A/G-specific adenine glycosylase [Clostridia bacterium]
MSLSKDLLNWYDANRRELPWRGTRDPYRIWLSEIMLQQTQAETVKGYYARFLQRFPTVEALAAAPEEAVLKLWEGLGYYSRAHNLHAASRIVSSELDGRFPQNASALRRLPGIGPYAANAIASIAYDEPVPALDGNQARVLSRILAWDDAIRSPFDLLAPALTLVAHDRPGDYNQALMDLGAMICTPNQPKCECCPIAGHCRALQEDDVLSFPRKRPPTAKKTQDWTILLMYANERLLVHKRPKGLLGGLYEFVSVQGHPGPDILVPTLEAQGFSGICELERLPDARHMFTHLVWRMQGWRTRCDGFPDSYTAIDPGTLSSLAFPSALRVYRSAAASS